MSEWNDTGICPSVYKFWGRDVLFLSGLLTNFNFMNYRKRPTKVLIPYVIWTVFYVYFNYFMNHYIPIFKGMVADVVASLINGKSAEMMYFIPVYCQRYSHAASSTFSIFGNRESEFSKSVNFEF